MPISTLDMDVLPVFGAISNAMRGPQRTFRPFFHVGSQAVVGRLACLTVVPAVVIFNVTPPPE